MIQTADALVKNDRKATIIHAKVFFKHTKALFDEFHVRQLEEERGSLWLFPFFIP